MKHVTIAGITVLLVAALALAQSVDVTQPFHYLQSISKTSTDTTKVDANNNGVIDWAENAYSCSADPICEATNIVATGDVTANRFCIGTSCITSWPPGPAGPPGPQGPQGPPGPSGSASCTWVYAPAGMTVSQYLTSGATGACYYAQSNGNYRLGYLGQGGGDLAPNELVYCDEDSYTGLKVGYYYRTC